MAKNGNGSKLGHMSTLPQGRALADAFCQNCIAEVGTEMVGDKRVFQDHRSNARVCRNAGKPVPELLLVWPGGSAPLTSPFARKTATASIRTIGASRRQAASGA